MYKVWTPRPVEYATRAEAIAAANEHARETGVFVAITEVEERPRKPAFEYQVHSDETTRIYRIKGEAMRAVGDLVALGKVVTVSQVRAGKGE